VLESEAESIHASQKDFWKTQGQTEQKSDQNSFDQIFDHFFDHIKTG